MDNTKSRPYNITATPQIMLGLLTTQEPSERNQHVQRKGQGTVLATCSIWWLYICQRMLIGWPCRNSQYFSSVSTEISSYPASRMLRMQHIWSCSKPSKGFQSVILRTHCHLGLWRSVLTSLRTALHIFVFYRPQCGLAPYPDARFCENRHEAEQYVFREALSFVGT